MASIATRATMACGFTWPEAHLLTVGSLTWQASAIPDRSKLNRVAICRARCRNSRALPAERKWGQSRLMRACRTRLPYSRGTGGEGGGGGRHQGGEKI